MKFIVKLNNESPVFSAAPGADRISTAGVINPPNGGMPYTRARRQKTVSVSPDGERKIVHVPVVPGNTMRSLLRRSILKNVIEPVLKGQVQLSVGAYAAMYSGNASGNPDGKQSTLDETVAMRAHAFLGLFAGGPRMLPGRLQTDALFPIHTDTAYILGLGFEDGLLSGSITDTIWTRRIDPFTKITDAEETEVIEGGRESVNAWISEKFLDNSDKKAKKDDEAESAQRGLQAFNAHEVVIPGVQWLWRLDADRPTDAQVGMILMGLFHLSTLSLAGGHAKGYGRFNVETISIDDEEVWQDGKGLPNAQKYIDAAMDELAKMDGEAFEQFAASSK